MLASNNRFLFPMSLQFDGHLVEEQQTYRESGHASFRLSGSEARDFGGTGRNMATQPNVRPTRSQGE